MEQLTIDYKFNLKDFKIMEDIEHSYFPNENITEAEEVMKWYQKNNLTCIGIRNSHNVIIASVNVLPLKKDIFEDIYENRINEADIVYEQIERYEDHKDLKGAKLWLNPQIKDFYKFDNSKDLKDIKIINYNHLGPIKFPIAQ